MNKLSFIASVILILFAVVLAASDVPVVEPNVMNAGLRLQRDMTAIQLRSTEIIREYERIQSDLKSKSMALDAILKSLERPGYKLDPDNWVYTPNAALDSKKSD